MWLFTSSRSKYIRPVAHSLWNWGAVFYQKKIIKMNQWDMLRSILQNCNKKKTVFFVPIYLNYCVLKLILKYSYMTKVAVVFEAPSTLGEGGGCAQSADCIRSKMKNRFFQLNIDRNNISWCLLPSLLSPNSSSNPLPPPPNSVGSASYINYYYGTATQNFLRNKILCSKKSTLTSCFTQKKTIFTSSQASQIIRQILLLVIKLCF